MPSASVLPSLGAYCGGQGSRSLFPLRSRGSIHAAYCSGSEDPLALTALLLIAQRHLGSEMVVRSDGGDPQWEDARLLCQQELGYGAAYRLDSERKLVDCTACAS